MNYTRVIHLVLSENFTVRGVEIAIHHIVKKHFLLHSLAPNRSPQTLPTLPEMFLNSPIHAVTSSPPAPQLQDLIRKVQHFEVSRTLQPSAQGQRVGWKEHNKKLEDIERRLIPPESKPCCLSIDSIASSDLAEVWVCRTTALTLFQFFSV